MGDIAPTSPSNPANQGGQQQDPRISNVAELVLSELLEQIALARRRSRRTKIAAFRNSLRRLINRTLNRFLPGSPVRRSVGRERARTKPRNASS
jgi:hypothetical protein